MDNSSAKHKRVAITGYLVWGLLTLWAYTAWRLPRALGLSLRLANAFALLFALCAISVLVEILVFVFLLIGPIEFAVYSVTASALAFYLTVVGFTGWLHISLRSRELARGDATERWERADMRAILFLIVALPLCASPALASWAFFSGGVDLQQSWSMFAATFFAGVVFHSWGTRLLVDQANAHLAWQVTNAGTAGAAKAVATNDYHVFISYRRDGGAETARLIRMALQERDFRVFLDVDDLTAGHFDERLLRVIETTPNLVVILSPGALERASNPDDWLRKEVEHGLATNRNLIPLLLPGFEFDDSSGVLTDLNRHNAVLYNHAYFDAVMDKLVSHLVNATAT